MPLRRISRPGRGNAGCRRARAAAGFTFFETIVVLALMAMMAVLAIPWFHKMQQRNSLKSAAFEIQSTLLAARMIAVRRNTDASVVIAPTTTPGAPYEIDVTLPTPPPTPLPGTPTPVAFAQSYFIGPKQMEFVTTPTGGAINFGGDGRVVAPAPPQPGIITIQGPPGIPLADANQITIQADSSGHVLVITPVDWH